MENALKVALARDELVLGNIISELRAPALAWMLSAAGFDFFIIDQEHGSSDFETMTDLIWSARGAGIAPIVRVPEIRREAILKPLDAGAAGLLIPQVERPEQVREVLHHAKYPPQGQRGAALRRPHSRYSPDVPAAEYLAAANEFTLIAIQIESTTAVENLEALLAVGGVDVVFVGPFDLSLSMGIPGESTHPRMRETITHVLTTARRHGVAAGIHLSNVEETRGWIQAGMRFVSHGGDIDMIVGGGGRTVTALRAV